MSIDMEKWKEMAEKIDGHTRAYQKRLWTLEGYCGCYSCKFFDAEVNFCGNLEECQKLNEFNEKWNRGDFKK